MGKKYKSGQNSVLSEEDPQSEKGIEFVKPIKTAVCVLFPIFFDNTKKIQFFI